MAEPPVICSPFVLLNRRRGRAGARFRARERTRLFPGRIEHEHGYEHDDDYENMHETRRLPAPAAFLVRLARGCIIRLLDAIALLASWRAAWVAENMLYV